MIKPTDKKIILEPSQLDFEVEGVLNPAIYHENGLTHMFYRAVGAGNYSSIGYVVLRGDEIMYRSPKPVLMPSASWERHGMEDPRLVRLKDRYYLFYTAYDGKDAQIAYAVADELPLFEKKHIISPPFTFGEIRSMSHYHVDPTKDPIVPDGSLLWDKDAFIFPEHINGKMAMLHRIAPDIQIMYFTSFEQLKRQYWSRYIGHMESRVLLRREFSFENGLIGGGVPPIRTEAGWLLIYHAVEKVGATRTYRAAAALLDINNPLKVIGRLPYPLFSPTDPWELNGVVNNVVFPSGAVIKGDSIDIYYGAADTRIGRICFNLPELLSELNRNPPTS